VSLLAAIYRFKGAAGLVLLGFSRYSGRPKLERFMSWSGLSPEEIERRRMASVEALRKQDRAEFERWYQEQCDRDYWTRGRCCAGCDHWQSDMGNSGQCTAAGIVSGEDVMRSQGITFSSYAYPPGFPWTTGDKHCGLFKDEFDWSTLDRDYLERIGALDHGKLKPKPRPKFATPHTQP
jgi:hypothetical protein